MRTLYPHERRPTVPGTLHGIVNQVNKSMFHAVTRAYCSNSDFYLVTEDTAFGDFDDLVIVTAEDRVTAIQYKHEREVVAASRVSINDTIITETDGDYKFYKYYGSLEEHMPTWAETENVEFEIATNTPLDQQFSACFNKDDYKFKEDFFKSTNGYFALTRRVILTSILRGNNKLTAQLWPDLPHYLDYLDLLLSNTDCNDGLLKDTLTHLFAVFKLPEHRRTNAEQKKQFIQKEIKNLRDGQKTLDDLTWKKLSSFLNKNVLTYSGITHLDVIKSAQHPEQGRVLCFLRKLRFSHSGPNKDRTAEATKEMLGDVFKAGEDGTEVLYNAFFCYCLEWLGMAEAHCLTRDEIREKFKAWESRYIELQQWIGISNAYQTGLVTTIGNYQFNRNEVQTQLSEFEKSQKRALILFGESGIGKTSVVLQYIQVNRKASSDYLMLDMETLLSMLRQGSQQDLFKYFASCKCIIIDNIEKIESVSETVREAFPRLIANIPGSVKLIFLYRTRIFSVEDRLFGIPKKDITQLEVLPFDMGVVLENFPFLKELSAANSFTLYAAKDAKHVLDRFVCHPFYLNLIVNFYQKHKNFKINFASTDTIIDSVLKKMLSSDEISACRRLLYFISQNGDVRSMSRVPEISALIKKQIISQEGSGYRFSHSLYEECVLRWTVESRLKVMAESSDDVLLIYREIFRVLPAHQLGASAFLASSAMMSEYYRNFCVSVTNSLPKHSAIYFLSSLVAPHAMGALKQHATLFYLLVDITPIDLLELVLSIVTNRALHEDLKQDAELRLLLLTVTIRCFNLSCSMLLSGRLFYRSVNAITEIAGDDSDFYMEHFFVDSFAALHSLGLMNLQSRLNFLRLHCCRPVKIEEYCYFQYIYAGLLKAANSSEIGCASYPGNNIYFRNSHVAYYHGYVTYRGECLPFREGGDDEDEKEVQQYQFNAMKLLTDLTIRMLKGEDNLWCVELKELLTVFEGNLSSLNIDDNYAELDYIIDGSSKILDILGSESEFAEKLNALIEEAKTRIHGFRVVCGF